MAGFTFYGTDADENLGTGYPWISPSWLLDDGGTLRAPTGGEDLAGDDTIYAEGGNDAVSGGNGRDLIHGGSGNDTIYVFPGDTAHGEGGHDVFRVLHNFDGTEHVDGGAGRDTLAIHSLINISGATLVSVERLAATHSAVSLTAMQLDQFDIVSPLSGNGAVTLQLTQGGQAGFAIDPALLSLTLRGTAEGETILIDPRSTSRFNYSGGIGDGMAVGALGGDALHGGAGHDTLLGRGGDDSLRGEENNDLLIGGAGNDLLDGAGGNDTASYAGAGGAVLVDLTVEGPQDTRGDGLDTLVNIESAIGGRFADTLIGTEGPNLLRGQAGDDLLDGGPGRDTLMGGVGADLLLGGAGNDMLFGEQGADTLGGNAGMDWFLYRSLADSPVGETRRDLLTDFERVIDVIHLAAIDADTTQAGNQRFAFIGEAAFSGRAGELRFGFVGGVTVAAGDVNGDGRADFEIALSGQVALSTGNFIL